MGIPLYFKTLSSNYPETIINDLSSILHNPIKQNYLFFDLNCAIHPCCRNIMKEYNSTNVGKDKLEKRMFTEIIEFIKSILELVQPTLVFIAIDGVAPFAKMVQQRERRYKSVLTTTMDEQIRNEMGMEIPNYWDTNAISPGTEFMNKLYEKIKAEIEGKKLNDSKKTVKKIIFSSANDPGEGEHKILKYIRDHCLSDTKNDSDTQPNLIVYGLDADLIMLSMSSGAKNIYLLREALVFNKIVKGKFLLLDIDYLKYALLLTLREHILEYDNCYIIEDINRIIDDYIFLCYFLGNDFLPHLLGISLKDGGHDYLLNLYISILVNYREYLVDKAKMRINQTFLYSLLNKMASQENELLQKFSKKRNRLRPSNRHSDDPYELRNNIINDLPITDVNNKEIEHKIGLGYDKFRSKYYKECFGIESIEEINEICQNYVNGIIWTFKYYNKECTSWAWKYNYRHPPLITDIKNYLGNDGFNINHIKFGASRPLEPHNQLLYILPKKSGKLLPIEYSKVMNHHYLYPDYFKIDMIYKRYFWQCQPILPDITYKDIKKLFQSVKIKDGKKSRNMGTDNLITMVF